MPALQVKFTSAVHEFVGTYGEDNPHRTIDLRVISNTDGTKLYGFSSDHEVSRGASVDMTIAQVTS